MHSDRYTLDHCMGPLGYPRLAEKIGIGKGFAIPQLNLNAKPVHTAYIGRHSCAMR